MATHRFHNNNNVGCNSFYGIKETNVVELEHLNANNDPMSVKNIDESKALQSIPSIFARQRFVDVAFSNCQFNGRDTSTYDSVVSKTLDLLEGIFNSTQDNYTFELFSFTDQIHSLKRSGFDGHKLLAEVLAREKQNVGNADTIFLIKDNNGLLIGGTSPFSLVYPSPNFNTTAEVLGLVGRSNTFRLFMYRYYCAMNAIGQANTAFWTFVNDAMNNDNMPGKPILGSYGMSNLKNDYDEITAQVDGNYIPVVCGVSSLFRVRPAAFTSQLYIKSSRQEFNQETTPIILPNIVPNPSRKVCGDSVFAPVALINQEKWDPSNDTQSRKIPGQTRRHSWVSAIDFFEKNLLVYPAKISADAFEGCMKINDDMFVLPPIRTLLFKYFYIDEIKEMLSYGYDANRNKKELNVSLMIPVCDEQNNDMGRVELCWKYTIPEIQTSTFNIAISPFSRINNVHEALNKHYVMLLHRVNCPDNLAQTLSFYNGDINLKVIGQQRTRKTTQSDGTTYYATGDFDNVEVSIGNCRGRLIPNFATAPVLGTEIYYAVDFGTTNTHVAYHAGKQAKSFDSADLRNQVKYLSYDNPATITDIEFMPMLSDKYKFPISTAVGYNSNNNNGGLFAYSSIGFNYLHELLPNEAIVDYIFDLKWKMPTADDGYKRKGKLFLTQILWMIKNHWLMNDPNAAKMGSAPKIVFTFPITDGIGSGIKTFFMTQWENIYKAVFGLNNIPAGYLKDMSESIAPCEGLAATLVTNGVLNVDIGGGTTDIQYILNKDYRYLSINLAADDIWGDGFEHCEPFPTYADDRKQNMALNKYRCNDVFNPQSNHLDYKIPTTQLVNFMFKESLDNVKGQLQNVHNIDLRFPMLVHYAAILFHIAEWLKISELQMPKLIQFSGMGSGYIGFLFTDVGRLKDFTDELLRRYLNDDDISVDITPVDDVVISKCKTAEGAATAMYKINNHVNVVMNSPLTSIIGIKEKTYLQPQDCQNIDPIRDDLGETLGRFIDGYNSAVNNYRENHPQNCEVYNIDKNKKEEFINNSLNSFDTIFNANHNQIAQNGIYESLIVWALKNSLWQI